MNLWLLLLFPFAGFLINGLLGRRLPKAVVNLVAVGSVGLSFAYTLFLISQSWQTFNTAAAHGPAYLPYVERYFTWIQTGSLQIDFALAMDRITALMLMIITGVGLLIHTYSIGYMSHEEGYSRFFAYLNLFMFFMLLLVLASNFLLLFVGWEGVGLCSYLLIGFYYKEKWATDAGNKAFIVNRIGDFGFMLAMFQIVNQFGTLDFVSVFNQAATRPVESSAGVITLICLLMLLGAAGKSAQIPLYVWLPDAMAGPTPVSALIHAATMVTAGIYLIARSAVLFDHAPIAMEVVALIGLATAVVAALIGMAQTDIKKVFAYSTVSQLGYMFLGLGVGAYSASLFHVMTHAFFKALLFLGAGSVIHALSGEQDLRKMGGLRSKIPITFATLMVAGIAIAGIPPFSGFYSKDEILLAAYQHAPWMYWVGAVTAGITAFYVFRALFLAFFGEYRGDAHPHESPIVMTGPLMVLALLSAGGGFLKVPEWLAPMFQLEAAPHNEMLVILSVASGVVGIGAAYYLYVLSPAAGTSLSSSLGFVARLVSHKFYVDELYNFAIVRPLVLGSRVVLSGLVDHILIDGLVHNVIGNGSARVGGWLSKIQSGHIRSYATMIVLGALLVVLLIAQNGGLR